MINWKEIYEDTIKKICEADANIFDNIVEIEKPNFSAYLIFNENSNENALFRYKLNENATEEDYKKFVEYIYNYIGEDINDFLPKNEEKEEENDMEEAKIRRLLKEYGAEDKEIENFMEDLKNTKEEIEEKEEDEEEFVLSPKNLEVLKATEEGKDLIMKAPEMTKEELKKAVYEFLKK